MSISRYYKPLTLTKLATQVDSANPGDSTPVSGKGFIQPVSASEASMFGKGAEKATHRLYCAISLNVEYDDTITQNGVIYKAVFVNQIEGISSVNHHKEVLLEAVS